METERQATNTYRKRRRAAPEPEETDSSGKKTQRGRPKADAGDESAADRRRTQIRLAQRAYRQRKETTISTLSKQVSALQDTIDELKTTITTFADFALGTDLPITHPSVALELSSTIEQVVLLCNNARDTGSETKGSDSDRPEASGRRSSQDQAQQTVQISHDENWLNPTLSSIPPSSTQPIGHGPHSSVDLPLGLIQVYDTVDEEPMDDMEEVVHQNILNQPNLPLTRTLPNNNVGGYPWYTETQFSAFVDNPPIYPIIPPNTLAAFANTNFIHYLRQMTVVNGHFALSVEYVNPQFVARCFQLGFTVESKEVVKAKFAALVHRTPEEMARPDHSTPLVQLGGAGSHYGQRQENSFLVKPGSTSWRALLEKSDNPAIACEIDFDWDDLGGEWFDHSDIEAWLRERDLKYNNNTMMGDALVDPREIPNEIFAAQAVEEATFFTSMPSAAPSPASLTSSGSTASAANSPLQSNLPLSNLMGFDHGSTLFFPPSKPTLDEFAQLGPTPRATLDLSDGLADMSADKTLLADPVMGIQPTDWAAFGGLMPSMMAPPLPKRQVRVDLNKMVLEMLTGCLCIGRAAAFRKVDVERAFRASIVSVK